MIPQPKAREHTRQIPQTLIDAVDATKHRHTPFHQRDESAHNRGPHGIPDGQIDKVHQVVGEPPYEEQTGCLYKRNLLEVHVVVEEL